MPAGSEGMCYYSNYYTSSPARKVRSMMGVV